MSDFNIADLPVVDDLNVPVSAEDYVDQANPAPAKPGNYRFVATKVAPRKNQDGTFRLDDGKFPVLVIEQAKIVEPVENERGVGLFADVRTKPFERKGQGGAAVVASDLYDLLRSYDETQNIDGFEHAKQLLQGFIDSNTPFYAQIGWTGYDKDFVDAEFNAIGATTSEARKAVAKDIANAIYSKARKGTKDFIQNGSLSPTVVGPSGNLVEAKLRLTRYFPSGTEVGKGKDAKGRQRIELGPFKAGQTK